MARKARKKSKSGNYYIVLKGEELFISDEDKKRFLEILEEKFAGGKVYGVKITKTEIRMAVKEGEAGISMIMKSVTTIYARYFNRENGREGKLFSGRFWSEPLETNWEIDECLKDMETGITRPVKKEKSDPVKSKAGNVNTADRKKTEKNLEKTEKPEKEQQIERPARRRNSLPTWLL